MKVQIDPGKFIMKPFKYQVEGVRRIVIQRALFLADEMGTGKTKQTIDAACVLHEHGLLDGVLVIAPASVRGVWDGIEGQVRAHCWRPWRMHRLEGRGWIDKGFGQMEGAACKPLEFVTVSYALARQEEVITELLHLIATRRWMMVLDESSAVKSRKSIQSKRCKTLSKSGALVRKVLLNGTPLSNNLLDLQPQFDILDPQSIKGMNFFQFRNRYAIMGGWMNKAVIGYKDVEQFTEMVRPWVLRREKADVLPDLPPKLHTFLEVPLSQESWVTYVNMRDRLIASMNGSASVASSGGVKVTRLSQLTSGYFAGHLDDEGVQREPEEIGREKLGAVLEWIDEHPGPTIFWCRFVVELHRLARALADQGLKAGIIVGGQKDSDRQAIIDGFQAGELDCVVGQVQAGGLGLTLTRAHQVVYVSNDYSLFNRLQSEDRCHRPGQHNAVTYVDVLATGPAGQRTVDHAVRKALQAKRELAKWTTDQWRDELLNP